ncbi:MAG: ATP-binding protein [bacterium]|nr:ATP-binding protein [bacterium]
MIKYLEDLLHLKTKDSQSDILFAQWNYDKKIIPTALNSVSALFPHYSLHDETHSITIINNIVRILGKENLERLSSIDIWLILEASYCHDIGMVVSSNELMKCLKKEDFLDFFKGLINDERHGLHEFAKEYEIKNNEIKYKKNNLSLEHHDGIKFILAEYVRWSHAERSKNIIVSPTDELGLSSPRGVIPQRIFKILGDICSCHTKNFTDVMNLPFCEVGIDIEDAHPRFIACLLRIGDLLDLDNNRFSEVMLRTLSRIPIDTLNHKAKHLSIESFRVDREKIEVLARCKDYETANITQHWFNYIYSEISQQMIKWNQIVPDKKMGYLPTIGFLKVELKDYDYIDGKQKPQFSVDTNKALELLQGTGLYNGAHQSFRELLQNAVDATLVRIWLENKDKSNFTLPNDTEFNTIAKNHPVIIHINEREIIDNNKHYEIKIIDKGIGISKTDLKFLMKTGSSSKNTKKTNIIENMPIWMKPSGTFGIGFQSIFMLTDLVKIKTKSYFNEEFLHIELNSPNSFKDGDILIKNLKSNHSIKPGTELLIDYKTKAIPSRWTIDSDQKNAMMISNNYDPFLNESLDIEVGKIVDEIFSFSNRCCLPVELYVNGKPIVTSQIWENHFAYYDIKSSLELLLNFDDKSISNHWSVRTFYKGQESEYHRSLLFLGVDVNIHKENASKILTLNRNKIKDNYKSKLYKIVMKSIFRYVTKEFDIIFSKPKEKMIGSMFLHYYSQLNYLKKYDISFYNHWENFEVKIGTKDFKLIDIYTEVDELTIDFYNSRMPGYEDNLEKEGTKLKISIRSGNPFFGYTHFLLFKFQSKFSHYKKLYDESDNLKKLILSNENDKELYELEDYKKLLGKLRLRSTRMIIPCRNEFLSLRLRDNVYKPYIQQYQVSDLIDMSFPKMLSPYMPQEKINEPRNLKVALNQKLYDWVYENRYNEETTIEEIKNGYNKYIDFFNIEEL